MTPWESQAGTQLDIQPVVCRNAKLSSYSAGVAEQVDKHPSKLMH